METTYFGTFDRLAKGQRPGAWIMSDMEAGLFSGYDARQWRHEALGAFAHVKH